MNFRLRTSTTFLAATVALVAPMVIAVDPRVAVALHTSSTTINYTGSDGSFTVPADVTSLHIVAEGGSGGGDGTNVPGKGAKVAFDVTVAAGDVIKVKVGGAGTAAGTGTRAGGWPNGGTGYYDAADMLSAGGGGGSTSVYKMNGATPVLLAVAAGGGGAADITDGGDGGTPGGGGGTMGATGMFMFRSGAAGGYSTAGGAGACVEDIADPSVVPCGSDGGSNQGGNGNSTYGGAGGGGGYYGGGGGITGLSAGGGFSWWDSSRIANEAATNGTRTGNGAVVISYDVADPIDSTYSLSWQTDGKIALSVRSIASGPAVNGTYGLYDSATVTGSPIATVTVSGNGNNATGTSSRTLLTSTRFAVKFTPSNGSYTAQNWENQRVQCAPGSYNATDGFIPCTVADIGNYVAYPGSTSQVPAPAGTYIGSTGQMTAIYCAAGTYQPNTGQSSCVAASIGYYVPTTHATSQIQCAAGYTTISTGQTSCISAVTTAPVLGAPVASSSWKIGTSNPSISYTIPEAPHPGTVKLRWTLSTDSTTYRELSMDDTTGTVNISAFDPLVANGSMAALSARIVSSTTKIANVVDATSRMPAGDYVFSVSYQNANQRPVATASASSVALRIHCTAGNYSDDGFSPCNPAPLGHYASADNTASIACAAGKYQSLTGQTSCIDATAGHYATPDGTMNAPCSPGSYQPQAAQSSCLLADPDHYVAGSGATSQTACASGFTAPNSGSASCVAVQATTTTTVPPTTTTVPPAGPSTGASSAKCSVKKGRAISRSCLATNAGITIASSSKVVIKVVASSAKVCKVSGSTVKTLKAGTCSTTVSVTPKSAKKATTYTVKVAVT